MIYLEIKHCYSRYDKLIPIPIIKKLAKQMLEGLHFLHENQVIHTDIKPENILLTKKIKDIKSVEDINLCIADLGTACWTFKHFTSNVQTTEYRAPEVIIKAHYNTKIDIWSIGCVIFELLANEYVFDSKHGSHFSLKGGETESESEEESESESGSSDDEEDYDTDYNQLFQMMQLFGRIPKHVLKNGKYKSSFFQRNGKLKNMDDYPDQISIEQRLLCNGFSEKDAKEIHDFLTPMFNYVVAKRITAKEALKHPWLNTDLRDLNQEEKDDLEKIVNHMQKKYDYLQKKKESKKNKKSKKKNKRRNSVKRKEAWEEDEESESEKSSGESSNDYEEGECKEEEEEEFEVQITEVEN